MRVISGATLAAFRETAPRGEPNMSGGGVGRRPSALFTLRHDCLSSAWQQRGFACHSGVGMFRGDLKTFTPNLLACLFPAQCSFISSLLAGEAAFVFTGVIGPFWLSPSEAIIFLLFEKWRARPVSAVKAEGKGAKETGLVRRREAAASFVYLARLELPCRVAGVACYYTDPFDTGSFLFGIYPCSSPLPRLPRLRRWAQLNVLRAPADCGRAEKRISNGFPEPSAFSK